MESKEKNKRIKIVVATHKKYRMPSDTMYLPLHVGAEEKKNNDGKGIELGYTKDNVGENISFLNSSFCELTGLYWAWKNLNTEYKGLVHYRRHFSKKKFNVKFEDILKYDDIKEELGSIKLFLPVKQKYYIENLYSHYSHTHYAEHLDIARDVIKDLYPEYFQYFDIAVKKTSGYMFNMSIMEAQLFDEYCQWLFDILFEIKKRINNIELSDFQGRFYGRISEIIFNVWYKYQTEIGRVKKSEVREIPVFYTEKIKWRKKIQAFLLAKFFGKKYEGSF